MGSVGMVTTGGFLAIAFSDLGCVAVLAEALGEVLSVLMLAHNFLWGNSRFNLIKTQ